VPAFSTIHAKDSSPSAIASAFAARDEIDPNAMVIIPCQPQAALRPLPQTLLRPRVVASAPPARRSPAAVQQLIQAQRFAVAGYFCCWDIVSRPSGRREVVRPGAFLHAIAEGGISLLVNHEAGPAIASQAADTLHVEEDARGAWFAACFDENREGERLYERARAHALTGASTSSNDNVSHVERGVDVLTRCDALEISILTAGHRPGRLGTWVLPYLEARRHRWFGGLQAGVA
jgi:HK97 family phage prohead protease